MGDSRKKRLKRFRLWEKQKGRCHYCNKKTVMRFREGGGVIPDDEATLEHLDDRFNPNRGAFPGEPRIVVACNQCNDQKGRESQASQPIEELWARSGRSPNDKILRMHADYCKVNRAREDSLDAQKKAK
jgi:hypothetical protein